MKAAIGSFFAGVVEAASGEVIATLLVDAIYAGYQKARQLKRENKKVKQELQQRIEGFLEAEEGLLKESSAFRRYLTTPQVQDILHDYLFLLTTHDSTRLKRQQIVEYLTDGAVDCYEGGVISMDRARISDFFYRFFQETDKFYFEMIPESQKYILEVFGEYFEHLEKTIKDCLGDRIIPVQEEYDETFFRYMKILKVNNHRSFIYGYAEYDLNKFYVAPKLLRSREEDRLRQSECFWEEDEEEPVEWFQIFSDSHIVYLVGGPGFGKSLFMKNVITNTGKLDIRDNTGHLVIRCDLKSYCHKEFANYSVLEFLRKGMLEATGMDEKEISKEFVEYYLKAGRCIILLDALDEVPKRYREKVHTLITGFFATYNPYNKICITSRDRDFLPKHEIEVYKIKPIDESDVRSYLDCMIKLKQFRKEDVEAFWEQAESLIRTGFLTSFLTLSLLVKIFRSEKELPTTKVELYDKCFDYIAVKREEEKDSLDPKFNWYYISKFMTDSTFIDLSKLAVPNNRNIPEEEILKELLPVYSVKFGNHASAEAAIREFLLFCGERTELLVPASEEQTYRFFHRSFFEYFYAKYLERISQPEKIWRNMKEFGLDSEIFELTTALLKRNDSGKYMKFIKFMFQETKRALQLKRPQGFPLFALSNMLRVVDDTVYHQQFLSLILDHGDVIMKQEYLDNLSLYSCMLVDDLLRKDKECREKFYEKYRSKILEGLLREIRLYFWDEPIKDFLKPYFTGEKLTDSIELEVMSQSVKGTLQFKQDLKEALYQNQDLLRKRMLFKDAESFKQELLSLTDEDWKEIF